MSATVVAQNGAITTDPPKNAAYPASFNAFAITSHGSSMNAIAYIAAGKGPHPVVVLLHGFPGNEKNLDIAQAMRRAGYDVVQFYYRGAWGSHGSFSFSNAMEDTAAAVAYIRAPENAKRLRADPGNVIMVGHSMGGWLALAETASDPTIRAVIAISAAEMSTMGPPPGGAQARDAVIKGLAARLEKEDMAPLAGCTGESLAAELIDNHAQWSFSSYAKGIGTRPAYFITSDDGLAAPATALQKALQAAGDTQAGGSHLATDHTYSDQRIALTQLVLAELAHVMR